MTNILSHKELNVTKELLNLALANSANSFSSMIKQEVLINSLDLQIGSVTDGNVMKINTEHNLFVLSSEIIGDLTGHSYLVFNRQDASEFFKLHLDSNNDNGKLSIMEEALLVETDNILTGAVITQFANVMNINLYGNVPSLLQMDKPDLEELIRNEVKKYGIVASFYTKFETGNLCFRPEFIWILTENFVHKIKELANNRKALSLLKLYKNKLNEKAEFAK